MNYKVSDIFYSLQGEGYFTGRAAVFVRLYGCNLNCSFCDEELHKTRFQNFEIGKIISTVNKYNCNFVVITGGEPSIRDCNPLIIELKEFGRFVAVETNGCDFTNIEEADWVTYSPKNWSDIVMHGWDEIKFVVNSRSNIEKILEIPDDKLIWLQPQSAGDEVVQENVDRCCAIIKKNPHLRLSLQSHKLIGIK